MLCSHLLLHNPCYDCARTQLIYCHLHACGADGSELEVTDTPDCAAVRPGDCQYSQNQCLLCQYSQNQVHPHAHDLISSMPDAMCHILSQQ